MGLILSTGVKQAMYTILKENVFQEIQSNKNEQTHFLTLFSTLTGILFFKIKFSQLSRATLSRGLLNEAGDMNVTGDKRKSKLDLRLEVGKIVMFRGASLSLRKFVTQSSSSWGGEAVRVNSFLTNGIQRKCG